MGDEEHTINGAYSEAEPAVLVSMKSEKDHQVCDSRQDNGRGAQSGSAHEELTCDDRVTQAGDLAEGQSQSNAMQGMAGSTDFDQTRTSQAEDEGESEIDGDVVSEERNGDNKRQTNAAFAINMGQRGDRMDKGEDGQDAKAEQDDGHA